MSTKEYLAMLGAFVLTRSIRTLFRGYVVAAGGSIHNFSRPYGTEPILQRFPALKRRAILGRPYGTFTVAFLLSLATPFSLVQQPALKAQTAKAPDKSKPASGGNPASRTDARSPDNPDVLRQMNSALQELAARVSPAVVQIQTTGYGPLTEGDGDRGRTALIVRQRAVGSGVIVDANGYIMTNAHVVEGAHRIRVALPMSLNSSPSNLPAGRRQLFDAKVLGVHKESDLALLKIEQTDLPTLSLEAPQNIHVGQMVLAVGSPEGLQSSVTMGVISAVARQADPAKSLNYVQTDAPINPGNSGGPLVDMDGYVVGINTFILSQSGGSEGLGFAIPARVVNFVYHSLRKYGHVHHVEMGAGAQEITPTLAEGVGLPQSWGVIVDDVTPDGPAAAAGVQVQDIILTADDRPIETLSALTAATYLHNPDKPVKLEILRGTDANKNKEKKILYVAAVEKHDQMDLLMDATDPEKSLVPRLGILVIDITDQIRSVIGTTRISGGVVVVGRAANLIVSDSGVQTGDIIHSLNTKPIDSVETLRREVRELKSGDAVVLQIERDGGLQYLPFEME
jgi:serine protease Do